MTKEEIREVRDALKLTREQFAQLLGVHRMTVYKWERGELEPSPYQVAMLTSFLKAAQKKPGVGKAVLTILVGAGIAAALYHILNEVFKDEKT